MNNLEKWKILMERKYDFKNPTPQEVFEFANSLTSFFDLLITFNNEDKKQWKIK